MEILDHNIGFDFFFFVILKPILNFIFIFV